MLINLKPLEARDANAVEVIRRLQARLAKVEGITLYMQPVQDLTIEDRVSRTQYQFTVEDADPDELATWVPRLVDRLRELPELADVASDLQDQGLQAYVDIDRATASRLGVTTAAIDNALYNAFGQRLISTIFTQTSQYRVVLEVQPEFRGGPAALNDIYVVSSAGEPVRLSAIARISERATPLVINHLGQFPGGDDLVQSRARRIAGPRGQGDTRRRGRSRPAGERAHALSGRGARVPGFARQHAAADPRRDRDDVHRARRALRKLHPSGHDPLDAAFGRRRRAARAAHLRHRPRHHRRHRHHPADRHREEERDHDDRLRARRGAQRKARARATRSSRRACCASGRS